MKALFLMLSFLPRAHSFNFLHILADGRFIASAGKAEASHPNQKANMFQRHSDMPVEAKKGRGEQGGVLKPLQKNRQQQKLRVREYF